MEYCLEKETVNIEDIDTNFIREYLIYRMDDLENGVSTTNTHIRTLKAFFNLLIKEEMLVKNPMTRVEYMREDIKIETFTAEDIQKILNYFIRRRKRGTEWNDERGYIAIKILLGTGIRSGELINLQWKNIDFENEAMIVFGKARAQRSIPLHHTLKEDLLHYKLYLKSIFEEVKDTDYVYCNKYNNKSSKNSIDNVFKYFRNKLKIEGVRVSPHTFRHTFAKNWIMSGGDVFSLQSILGHQKIETTQKYVNIFATALKEQNDKYNPLANMGVE